MSDIDMGKLKEKVIAFVKKKGYRELLVEIFVGGEEEGEIFIEGEAISFKSFDEISSLFSFLERVQIAKVHFGKSAIFVLSKEGIVYVIHGLSVRNFI